MGRGRRVFVSGCYDVLHGGHLEFFTQARALGDHLIVCVSGAQGGGGHDGLEFS